ncbi:unnamed protein product, partial [Didymodactylos carnosus]
SNRIHLTLKTTTKENIEQALYANFNHFKENLTELGTIIEQNSPLQVKIISLTPWLKYYSEMYAFALIKTQSHHEIMREIDRLLSNNSRICLSIKIFIMKQMMYFDNKQLYELKNEFLNRNIQWIKPIALQQDEQKIREDLILPLPLFECKEEYIHVNKIFKEVNNV